jgi:HK97 family phage portal protein
MGIKNTVKSLVMKAISYVGWDTPEGPIGGWPSNRAGSSEMAKYGAAIKDPLHTPLIMAAVQWLCRTINEPKLKLVKRDDQDRVIKVRNKHHVLKLVKDPNPFYDGMTMMKGLATSWDLNGNAYLLKWRDPETLRVEWLTYEPHYSIRARWYGDNVFSRNQVTYADKNKFVAFYEIYRPNEYRVSGEWVRVETDDVIHFRDGLDPLNPHYGINKLACLLAELYTDQQRAYFSATVLSNIGMIPFVISPRETGQSINEQQANKLKEDLKLRSQGQKGEPIVAGRAIRIDELGFSPEDMDLKAMAAIPEERVASVIGPNSYVLGFIPENSVYTNFLEARRDAYESFLIPLQNYFATQLTKDLLREFILDETQNLEYDYSDVYAMLEWQMKRMDMWGKAFRDGIAKRSTCMANTGQTFEEDEEDGFYEDFNSKSKEEPQDDEKLPNPGNPGPKGQPGRELIDDGNERVFMRQDRGPVAGGKKV